MLLEAKDIVAGYHKKTVLHEVNIGLAQGEILALIGHNGAGKTTLLKAIMGIVRLERGSIHFEERNVTNRNPALNVKDGIALVPQGIRVFSNLSVLENLKLGAFTLEKNGATVQEHLQEVYDLFPILRERRLQKAGTLSGGQQQMVALGRALMTRPKVLLLDEPSLGLAPVLVQKVLESIVEINRRFGTSMVLVEQNVKQALCIASRVYVMKVGQIVLEDRAERLLERGQFWDLF